MPSEPSTRLHAFIASEARVGVILRRGPTRHVRMIRWDLANDTFEPGQWLLGRIYEDRCGLSPDGRLVEEAELADQPFMLGSQFHPEFRSRPTRPHPLFVAFLEAAAARLQGA